MTAQVTIKLLDSQWMGEFYFAKDPVARARSLKKDGWYQKAGEFTFEGEGEDAAEEAFDLTNNPCRQEERVMIYGRKRSVSVGDIIEVDGVEYLCASMGWTKL